MSSRPLLGLALVAATAVTVLAVRSQWPSGSSNVADSDAGGAERTPGVTSTREDGVVGAIAERQLLVTEAEVNQQIARSIAQNPGTVPLQEARIRLRSDGKVDFRGVAEVAGRETEVLATLRVTAKGGTFDIEVEGAQAGGVTLPSVVVDQLAERGLAAAGLRGLRGNRLPPDIDSVSVREGVIVITRR